jgi:hypothetical protein
VIARAIVEDLESAPDVRACLVYAHRLVAHERVEPALTEKAA